ncbi:MAG: Asp-tRNA(Asn)/Glu-tRNA(Gln) amidotransferase subunit GatC [Kofleriaceae bacterium]
MSAPPMAALSADEVATLARLARLALTDDEAAALRVDLAAILDHVAALAEVDVDEVAPMTHGGAAQPLRADLPAPSLPVEAALAGTSAVEDDQFVVPAAISGVEP